MPPHAIGTVVSTGFAPVKGVRHTAYDEVHLDRLGPVGDRELCLVDEPRQRVLRTVQHPSLVAVRARRVGDALTVRLPGGQERTSDLALGGQRLTADYWGREVTLELLDTTHDALFSDYLGTPVRLARAPRRAVVYGAEVSLVTTASMRALAEHAGDAGLADQAARFRPTLVLDVGDEPHVEDAWIGRELTVGQATIRLNQPIPRCAVVDLDPDTGVKGGRVLTALAGYRPRDGVGDLLFGVDARPVAPGVVRPGDPVHLV